MQRWFQLVEKVFCLMCLCYIVQLYYDSRLPIVLFCKIALLWFAIQSNALVDMNEEKNKNQSK